MRELSQYITEYADRGAELRNRFFLEKQAEIARAALVTAIALTRGRKLLVCGNGGSAADAQHIAGEFVNRFLFDRPALPAIALTTDSSVLTAISNDYSYDKIFSRQVEALGKPGDILLAISTSGKSPNILAALEKAREKEMFSIGLTGSGEAMNGLCDIVLNAPGSETPLIQEIHLAGEHMYCALVERLMFSDFAKVKPYLDQEGYPDAYI